jgi:hypothetical protein
MTDYKKYIKKPAWRELSDQRPFCKKREKINWDKVHEGRDLARMGNGSRLYETINLSPMFKKLAEETEGRG